MKLVVVPSSLGVGAAGVGTLLSRSAKGSDRFAVTFEGFAPVIGEVELFEHLVDAVLDDQELASAGGLGDVERAAGAGQPVGALGEEVVRAVALTQVWADRGYAGDLVDRARDRLWLTLRNVSRPKGAKGFVVLPRRWKVERTIGWCYERPPQRTRLRTAAPALRSTPELGTHHHDDPAPDPREPPNEPVETETPAAG